MWSRRGLMVGLTVVLTPLVSGCLDGTLGERSHPEAASEATPVTFEVLPSPPPNGGTVEREDGRLIVHGPLVTASEAEVAEVSFITVDSFTSLVVELDITTSISNEERHGFLLEVELGEQSPDQVIIQEQQSDEAFHHTVIAVTSPDESR